MFWYEFCIVVFQVYRRLPVFLFETFLITEVAFLDLFFWKNYILVLLLVLKHAPLQSIPCLIA
jgi:hypothetical protein